MKTHNFKLVKTRKMCICSRCTKNKLHFGLGMCSACLRRTKRETRPEFYLGTQYSEIKRRCTHKNVDNRNYLGKRFCSKSEFINKFKNDTTFLTQYKNWQISGFKRGDSPSIDRIDNNGDYTTNNLQILPHRLNGAKDKSNKVILYLPFGNQEFKSQRELADYLNVPTSVISTILNNKKPNTTGYRFERKNENP